MGAPRSFAARALRPVLLAALPGLVTALGSCGPPDPASRPRAGRAPAVAGPRVARLWALDGLRGELLGLDAGLAQVRSMPLSAGVELQCGSRLFALVDGGRRVQARDPETGRLRAERLLAEPARDAALRADELVLLLGDGPRARLLFLGPALDVREVAPLPGAYLLAGSGEELVVARGGERLARCRGRPLAVVAEARQRGRVTSASLDRAPATLFLRLGARRLACWRLAHEPAARGTRREAWLAPLWERRFAEPLTQVVADGSGGVWCVLAGGGALRLGPQGQPAAAAERLPCRRVVEALGVADGRLLLACVGALVELDGGGRATRSQGGFGELLALVASP